jgi:hypothetical protein
MRGFATGTFTIIYNVETDEGSDPEDTEQIRGVATLGLRRAGMSSNSQASNLPRNVESYRGRAPSNAPLYQSDLKTGSLRLVETYTGFTYIVESISEPTSGIGHTSIMFSAHRVL